MPSSIRSRFAVAQQSARLSHVPHGRRRNGRVSARFGPVAAAECITFTGSAVGLRILPVLAPRRSAVRRRPPPVVVDSSTRRPCSSLQRAGPGLRPRSPSRRAHRHSDHAEPIFLERRQRAGDGRSRAAQAGRPAPAMRLRASPRLLDEYRPSSEHTRPRSHVYCFQNMEE